MFIVLVEVDSNQNGKTKGEYPENNIAEKRSYQDHAKGAHQNGPYGVTLRLKKPVCERSAYSQPQVEQQSCPASWFPKPAASLQVRFNGHGVQLHA
jgi:hypothetical protein